MPGITKLIGIYDADGGIFGEIKYFAGKIFANQHCSLCDITHGKSKNEWAKCEIGETSVMPLNGTNQLQCNANIADPNIVTAARKVLNTRVANLDYLCRRFKVDLSERDLHGALLDSRLLAEVYLELKGGKQFSMTVSYTHLRAHET